MGKKEAGLKGLKGSVRLRGNNPAEEIQPRRRKRILPDPPRARFFPRACRHETALRRGLYLTKALYYSRPLGGKSPVSERLDKKKTPDWTSPPKNNPEQIRTL